MPAWAVTSDCADDVLHHRAGGGVQVQVQHPHRPRHPAHRDPRQRGPGAKDEAGVAGGVVGLGKGECRMGGGEGGGLKEAGVPGRAGQAGGVEGFGGLGSGWKKSMAIKLTMGSLPDPWPSGASILRRPPALNRLVALYP